VHKYALTASVAWFFVGAAEAQAVPPPTPRTLGLSALGKWDCCDANGAHVGAVVIFELSNAFINPD
jgi:hypothetical protein